MIFGTSIPKATDHQMAVQFPTSPNICFYTTWGKQKRDPDNVGVPFFETQCISGVLCFLFVSVSSVIESLCTVLNFQCFVT